MVAYSPEVSIPLLKREFAANPTFDGALVLCILRQKEGAGLLIEWLDKQSLKKGRPYTGPLQEFIRFVRPPATPQEKPDILELRTQITIARAVWALGRSGDRRAVPVLARMLESCTYENDYFSHMRALTFALGWLGGPEAAQALAKFLDRPGVSGHMKRPGDKDAFEKWQATVELFAAASLYRAGDVQDKGKKILEAYGDDWRGVYVRFAHYVLNEK
jgi:hypothetical protein